MKIVVLGAAESGVGAAILAQQKGFDVFVSDMGSIQEKYKQMLDAHNLEWEELRHTEERILAADEVIKSPGIPDTAPMMQKVIEHGIPVISEIEFAARYTDAKMVCITGSNGKTTTTSLIHHILKKAGLDVGLAGNIGNSLALQVAETPHDCYVIELSSFQLDNMYDFRAHVAVLLNITPDHLDRYGFEMQNYVNSKMRILQNQQAGDTFIYWDGDEYIGRELPRYSPASRVCAFGDAQTTDLAAYINNNKGVMTLAAPTNFSLPVTELSLQGKHNLRNCMAAALATLAAGASPEAVAEGLKDFPGVPHRLERVGTFGGVHFINDSKATNVDACYCALDSMTTPVVLIIGGTDKGNDYAQILPLVRKKCRAVVYLGADNAKLHATFDDLGILFADTHSMEECVAACLRFAQVGDTVLLSPCCASFDLFKNMADRGNQFKTLVKTLS